jgi:hypothetical protein
MRLYLKLAFMIALTAFLQLRIIDPYKNKLQADVDTRGKPTPKASPSASNGIWLRRDAEPFECTTGMGGCIGLSRGGRPD